MYMHGEVLTLYMIHALTIAGRNASGDTYKMGGGVWKYLLRRARTKSPWEGETEPAVPCGGTTVG